MITSTIPLLEISIFFIIGIMLMLVCLYVFLNFKLQPNKEKSSISDDNQENNNPIKKL